MEVISMESSVYQDLIDRLNRIEQYVERTCFKTSMMNARCLPRISLRLWMYQNLPYTVGVKRI